MPQASEELRDLMGLLFDGERTGSAGPKTFLMSRGYKILPSWRWEPPAHNHYPTEKEELCLRFLVLEWDYGWIL